MDYSNKGVHTFQQDPTIQRKIAEEAARKRNGTPLDSTAPTSPPQSLPSTPSSERHRGLSLSRVTTAFKDMTLAELLQNPGSRTFSSSKTHPEGDTAKERVKDAKRQERLIVYRALQRAQTLALKSEEECRIGDPIREKEHHINRTRREPPNILHHEDIVPTAPIPTETQKKAIFERRVAIDLFIELLNKNKVKEHDAEGSVIDFLEQCKTEGLERTRQQIYKELDLPASPLAAAPPNALFTTQYNVLSNLVADLYELLRQIKLDSKELKATYIKIIDTLRKIESNTAYQFLKAEETHPVIHYIHTLALALYTEPCVLQAYKLIGDPLYAKTVEEMSIETQQPPPLCEILRNGRNSGSKYGLTLNDKTLGYVITNTKQAFGALSSHHIGEFLGSFDPHGEQENYVGAAYDMTYHSKDHPVTVRRIYTPTPTLGNAIAPEVKLVAQAMQNRHFMSAEELKQDPYPYFVWHCSSLQNITSSEENERAVAIMKLQREFPLSFKAITIAMDSPFQKDGLASHNEESIAETLKKENSGLDQTYLQRAIQELENNTNFSLEDRTKTKDGGYYFPATTVEEKEQILKDLKTIANTAFGTVILQRPPKGLSNEAFNEWKWQQKAAFRQLLNMGIITYFETKIAENLPPNAKMISSSQCKECIDRGSGMTALCLWGTCPETTENNKITFSVFHARALLCRNRIILADRAEPNYALVKICPHEAVHRFLDIIYQGITQKQVFTGYDAHPVVVT